jgi:hypothetical protein
MTPLQRAAFEKDRAGKQRDSRGARDLSKIRMAHNWAGQSRLKRASTSGLKIVVSRFAYSGDAILARHSMVIFQREAWRL